MQFSWAPLLKDLSRLDTNGVQKANRSIFLTPRSPQKKKKLKRKMRYFYFSNKPISENSLTQKIKQQIENGEFGDATNSWSDLENVISTGSSSVVRIFLSTNP